MSKKRTIDDVYYAFDDDEEYEEKKKRTIRPTKRIKLSHYHFSEHSRTYFEAVMRVVVEFDFTVKPHQILKEFESEEIKKQVRHEFQQAAKFESDPFLHGCLTYGIVQASYYKTVQMKDLTLCIENLERVESSASYQNLLAIFYNMRGWLRDEYKMYKEALSDYTLSLKFRPDYTDAMNNRGFAYVTLEQYSDAIVDYSNAIALEPDDAVLYDNRSSVYLEVGNFVNGLTDAKMVYLLTGNSDDYNDVRKSLKHSSRDTLFNTF
jgi:tetratricopeptide (TPR) repeat protein